MAPQVETANERRDQQELQQEEQEGTLDQRKRFEMHEQQREQADQRIDPQNVAPPEQQEMRGPDDEQPTRPDHLRAATVAARHFLPVDQQQHRRAEQQREQAAHLAIDQDQADRPETNIATRKRPDRGRVEISGLGQGEGVDVHPHYAHHRATAQHVHGGDAGGRGHGRRFPLGVTGQAGLALPFA